MNGSFTAHMGSAADCQMRTARPLYTSCPLAAPILLLVAGDADEKTYEIIERLAKETVVVEPGRYDVLVAELSAKNISYPNMVRARYIDCPSLEDFLLVRERLRGELELFYLSCYSVVVVVDVALNRDRFKEIKEQMGVHFYPKESVGFVYYRATEELAAEHSDTTHIAFARNKMESMVDGVNNFAEKIVMDAFLSRYRTVPKIEGKKKRSVEQVIPMHSLWFCSVEANDAVDAFVNCLKDMDDARDSDVKRGAIYETMGLFYREHDSMPRNDRIPYGPPSLPGRFPVMTQGKDSTMLFGMAVYYYWRKKKMDKLTDVMLRIVQDGADEWIDCCADVIRKDHQLLFMEARAWELMTLVAETGKMKKVAFLAYLFASDFKDDDQKIDFMLEVVKLLSEQSPSDVVMKDLCTPRVTSLMMAPLDRISISKMIFKLLANVGPILDPPLQHKLFYRLYEFCLGDRRLSCELGFQISGCEILDSPLKIHKVEKGTGQSQGPFLYSFFGNSKSDRSSCEVGVGWDVRIAVDLFNPFAIDLPGKLALPDLNCEHGDVPVLMKKKCTQRIELGLVPVVPGDIVIDKVCCLIYEGFQELPLPKPLKITAYENAVAFTCQTDLPLEQTMKLFDGEALKFNLWITNNGTLPIDKLEIKGRGLDWITPIELPLNPSDELLVQAGLTIVASMKELNLTIVAGSNVSDLQSVIAIRQPMSVEPGVVISAIEPVSSLPEIDASFADLMFLAVDISNFSSSVFDYVASFSKAAQISLDFEGIVTEKEKTGILASYQTTAFIVAIEKETLRIASEKADQTRVMNACKQEEERRKKKISSAERPAIRQRVGIATLIEENLHLIWSCGSGRTGTLIHNNALPSAETLTELSRIRPKTSFFVVDHDLDNIPCEELIDLVVNYEGVKIIRCSLLLGVNMDPDYGVAWDGSLDQELPEGGNEFRFTLYFATPGQRDFHIEYETIDHVQGRSSVSFVTHE